MRLSATWLVNGGAPCPDASPSCAAADAELELFRGGGLASSNSGFMLGIMARDGACAAARRLATVSMSTAYWGVFGYCSQLPGQHNGPQSCPAAWSVSMHLLPSIRAEPSNFLLLDIASAFTGLYRAPRASITAATVVSVRRAVWDRKWALGCMPGRGGCCLCACPTALRRTGLATLPPE